MAGAFTTTGVCLLFLVPFLLPAEVEEEWIRRSNGIHTRLDSSASGISSEPGTKSSYAGSDTESNVKELDVKESIDLQNDPAPSITKCQQSDIQRLEGSTISLNYILERYLSMPKLTSQQDAVLGNIYNSRDHVWIPFHLPVRETDV